MATAFRTGSCDGKDFSSEYGDLGAAVACILLDREARSATLHDDPTHGSIREPFLKVMHVLRSLEFQSGSHRHTDVPDNRQIEMTNLEVST